MVELTENEMLVYNKVVNINRTINKCNKRAKQSMMLKLTNIEMHRWDNINCAGG